MTKDERRDKRIPIGLKVRFKSATIAEFIEHYSRDLSRGGIFIRTDSPMPIGTLIKFDICLQDEKSLIQGVGRVVWRRDENVSDEVPAGMGIKFIKLDESSRANLDLITGEPQGSNGKLPGEPPIIVETQGETVDENGPPQPIAPVRPQAMPKGAKRTMIGMGMGPSPKGASAAPGAPTAAAEGEAEEKDGAAPAADGAAGGFLADISSAIDTALGSSDSSPPTGATTAEEAPAEPEKTEAPAEPEKKAAEEEAPAEPEKKAAEAEAPAEPEKKEAAAAVAATGSAPVQVETKEAAKPAEKPAQPAAVRIGADTKERRGVPPIVWLLLIAGAAGAIYYFGFYAPEQEGSGEATRADVTAEAPKKEPPKPEPPKPEPQKPEPPKPMAKIEIATTPAGAVVTIDGAVRDGVTPLVLDGLTPQKEIAIEARLFGYAPSAQKAVPGEGEPLKVEMKLTPVKVDLEFKTTPPGAQVKSGDKWLCKTPRSISQKGMTSDLAYTISKPGYQDVSGAVSQSDFSFVDGAYKALVEVTLAAVAKPVEPPKVVPPKAEPPKVEPPKAEKPKAEPPKAEKPKEEPPKAEKPKEEPPKAEKPKEEPPKPEPPKKTGDIEEDPYG